jgi:hypothetical protein
MSLPSKRHASVGLVPAARRGSNGGATGSKATRDCFRGACPGGSMTFATDAIARLSADAGATLNKQATSVLAKIVPQRP